VEKQSDKKWVTKKSTCSRGSDTAEEKRCKLNGKKMSGRRIGNQIIVSNLLANHFLSVGFASGRRVGPWF
jgi:hypothetical protein